MFENVLLTWYMKNKRDLPWRENHNPYRIWLSEIMLQQTQVATVIDYFKRFIKRYPTVQDLAQANEDEVLKLWEGLGYYSRARRLIPCAKQVVQDYDGLFPKTYKEMLTLPGVGSYTAGAILSIAYNINIPAVDGNVMRVYSRVKGIKNDISIPSTKKHFEEVVKATLPDDARHYNQGLMDFGATVCTPKLPKCETCPIQSMCYAYANNQVSQLPVKSKKIKKKSKDMMVLFMRYEDEILIIKRPPQGLLASMWSFPLYDVKDHDLSSYLEEEFDISSLSHKVIKTDKHIFTHLIWNMTFVEVYVSKKVSVDLPESKWIKPEALKEYPLPVAFSRLLK